MLIEHESSVIVHNTWQQLVKPCVLIFKLSWMFPQTWFQILQILNISVSAPKELFQQCADGTLLVGCRQNSSSSVPTELLYNSVPMELFQKYTTELFQQGVDRTLLVVCRRNSSSSAHKVYATYYRKFSSRRDSESKR